MNLKQYTLLLCISSQGCYRKPVDTEKTPILLIDYHYAGVLKPRKLSSSFYGFKITDTKQKCRAGRRNIILNTAIDIPVGLG